MNLNNKIAIITGISKGLGKAITEKLLSNETTVYGLGITEPSYQHPNLHFIQCNIRKEEEVNLSISKILSETNNQIDILINNSGLGYFGFLEELDMAHIDEMMEVCLYGTIYCTRNVLSSMKTNKSGHIINISSTAGLEGMAQSSIYCAVKHAIKGFSDSLFRELKEFNIKTTAVYPGAINTDFFNNAQGIKAHDKMMSPLEVADQIIHILTTSDNFIINELVIRPLNIK